MLNYSLKRLLLVLPTMLIVATAVFIIMRAVPGDPAALLVGDMQNAGELERVRRELGLDQPLWMQFSIWLKSMLSLDFGHSLISGEPVFSTMLDSFQVTLQIVVPATLVATLVALPCGMLAAWKQDRTLDFTIVMGAVLALSMPSFWVALMLIAYFGVELRWLPTVGYVPLTTDFATGLSFLVMPIVCLVMVEVGSLTRIVRASAIDILRSDFIDHARAKGLPEHQVLFGHALKNAVAPAMSLLGIIFGSLLAGAAIIETVFTMPGLGRLLVESIYSRDYPMIQGIMLFVALIYVIVNLIVDLVYPLLDPRVRL